MKAMSILTKSSSRAALTDRATAYAEAVLSGEIIAGPHVRNSCRRHLDDLANGAERGLTYDIASAEHIWNFFEGVFRLSEGQFEDLPFTLQPSQAFILGMIFGWKRSDGTRRFRRAYIEQGKGNGKSPIAGGVGLYGMTADGEAGAQIYAAAAKKEQAAILFQDACKMVRKSPALTKKLQFSGGMGREFNIAHHQSQSFFRPISKDAGKTGSGPRPHFALCDEVHEHPDRSVMELLERGFKFRREPLLLMITNSGSDRHSVCFEEHTHAVRVAAGTRTPDEAFTYVGEPIDDTTFSYVCALDSARTAAYALDIALCHAAECCTCNAQITQIDLPSPQDFAALVTQGSVERITSQKGLGASITPSAKPFLDAFVILVTRAGEKRITPNGGISGALLCGITQRANGQRNVLESAIPNTGSERSSPILRGKLIGLENVNTGYPANRPLKLELTKAADAAPAAIRKAVYGWITATIVELFGASCATNVMLESACSEIMRRLFEGHSNTCKIRQRFHLQSDRLAEDLPADDFLEDPSCWEKANPLLGVTIQREYLTDVVRQAKALPGKLNGILRLHGCVWTDADQAWMGRAALEDVLDDFDPIEHSGEQVYVGLDLSATNDLTAAAFVVPTGADDQGRPTFDAWVEAWTPGATLSERALRDNTPYDVWVRDGWLNAAEGRKMIGFDFVAARIAEISGVYDIQSLAYDSYGFKKHFEPELDALGLTLPIVEHPQGGKKKGAESGLWMPGSKLTLEGLILERRIRLRRSPVLISAMMSAAVEGDPFGNFWFSKRRATNRIDALVALAMAVGTASAVTETDLYSDGRGLRVL